MFITLLKVPIRILHICNISILLKRIVIYLVGRRFYLRGLFAVKFNGNDVNLGICVIVKIYSYTENISLDSEPNRYYSMKINRISQNYGSFVKS